MKSVSMVLLLLTACVSPVFADAYVKSRLGGGITETEVWTEPKKQRTVSKMPIIGDVIKIERADKGVEWEIRPALKSYSERQIPLEYTPAEGAKTAEEKKAEKEFDAEMNKSAEAIQEDDGNCTTTKVGEKKIAGMGAEGYQGACKDEEGNTGGKMTLWVANANEKKAADVQKLTDQFAKALVDSMYSKYPPKEAERIKKSMAIMGMAMAKGMMGMPSTKKMPQRMILGMESAAGDEGGMKGMMVEVIQADIVPADASRYEVPEGYTKVENLGALESQHMMSQMASGGAKFSDLIGGLGDAVGAPATAEEKAAMRQADPVAQDMYGMIKTEAQLQGQWEAPKIADTESLSTTPPEAWQQGLYDQGIPQQTTMVQQTTYTQTQTYAPQQNYPPQRRRSTQQADLNQTLSQVQQLVSSVQGIAQGGGLDGMDMSQYGGFQQEGYNSGFSDEEYSEDYQPEYSDEYEEVTNEE